MFLSPAAPRSAGFAVDLELVLAVDASSSMSAFEREVQRDGYVNAIRHPAVARAIASGRTGKIAVTYLEWAGPGHQRVVVPWTIIRNSNDADRFAQEISEMQIVAGVGTSISGGLLAALRLLEQSPVRSERRVIDISGDGTNNIGPPVTIIRDQIVAAGITINGLAISLPRDSADTFESFDRRYLDSYFENCVIGGPDAFVFPIDSISRFEVAIRRKLVREIAGTPALLVTAAFGGHAVQFMDCLATGQSPGR